MNVGNVKATKDFTQGGRRKTVIDGAVVLELASYNSSTGR